MSPSCAVDVSPSVHDVHDVMYRVHIKRDAEENAPRTLRVDYQLGLDHWQSEFICVEHTGYARRKAEAWWRERSPDPFPDSAEHAVAIAEAGGVAFTERIKVRSVAGEPYDTIVGYQLGPMPEAVEASSHATDEIPF